MIAMTVGEKIRKFRTEQNLLQKDLAQKCRMSESAIRNYELGNRTPSPKHLEVIASALGVSVFAISEPNLNSELGVMHALFEIEENYNLKVVEENGIYYLQAAPKKRGQASISDLIIEWGEANKKYQAGEITKEEYAHWKDTFPESIAINKRK